jgi:PilZ domain
VPDSLDRRASPRWVAVKNQATLEFQGGEGKQRAKATLVNISRSGALIVTDEILPLRGTLWFRMESPAKTDWIGVVPVRHDKPHQIGIRFAKPCLDDLLLAAMLGIDLGANILEAGRPPTFADLGFGM